MQEFRENICRHSHLARWALALVAALLVLSVLAVPFVPAESASYYITLVNFVMLAGLSVALLVVLWVCKRAEKQRRERAKELETVER